MIQLPLSRCLVVASYRLQLRKRAPVCSGGGQKPEVVIVGHVEPSRMAVRRHAQAGAADIESPRP